MRSGSKLTEPTDPRDIEQVRVGLETTFVHVHPGRASSGAEAGGPVARDLVDECLSGPAGELRARGVVAEMVGVGALEAVYRVALQGLDGP
jgi:hypothetical protein